MKRPKISRRNKSSAKKKSKHFKIGMKSYRAKFGS